MLWGALAHTVCLELRVGYLDTLFEFVVQGRDGVPDKGTAAAR